MPCGRTSPITRKPRPAIRTDRPSGSEAGKSVVATSAPITATCAACWSSAGRKNRPSPTSRSRIRARSDVVPLTLAPSYRRPPALMSALRCVVGATITVSPATRSRKRASERRIAGLRRRRSATSWRLSCPATTCASTKVSLPTVRAPTASAYACAPSSPAVTSSIVATAAATASAARDDRSRWPRAVAAACARALRRRWICPGAGTCVVLGRPTRASRCIGVPPATCRRGTLPLPCASNGGNASTTRRDRIRAPRDRGAGRRAGASWSRGRRRGHDPRGAAPRSCRRT